MSNECRCTPPGRRGTGADPQRPARAGDHPGADRNGFRYDDPSGAEITSPEVLHRVGALAIPPAWKDVWISPDPLGHIQATGVDSRGRTQYRYHQVWREQRDAQKFAHMLRFAEALPDAAFGHGAGSRPSPPRP